MQLQQGESRTCRNCHKAVLGPGACGINPNSVCCCDNPQPIEKRMSSPNLPDGWGEVHNPVLRTAIDAWSTAWRPIETAPKVGKGGPQIMLYSPAQGVCVGTWHGGFEWVSVPGMYGRKPTHWLPLPALPIK